MGVEGHVVSGAGLASHLHVDVAQVLDGKGLALLSVQQTGLVLSGLLEAVGQVLLTFSFFTGVDVLEELVVFFVDLELHGVLVVGEKSIVAVGLISKVAALNKWSFTMKNLP